jgi:hypothetical protein
LPQAADFGPVVTAAQYLGDLMGQYPRAVPRGGIVLSFPEGGSSGKFAEWDDAKHEMGLRATYFGSYDGVRTLRSRLRVLERTGQSPQGCDSPEYLVTHEFGHCLRHRLDKVKYARWWMRNDLGQVCRGAREDPSEAFAEGFAVISRAVAGRRPEAVVALHRMLREDGVL